MSRQDLTRFEVLFGKANGSAGYAPGDKTMAVLAVSELDAVYQAAISLALHLPASQLRALIVKAVRSEADAEAPT